MNLFGLRQSTENPFRKKYQNEMSTSPRPTTTKPITAPEENATFKPAFKLFCAAFAVRELAAVAIFIPINPERPEKNPPVRKANGTNMVRNPLKARIRRITKITAKKMLTPMYCRFK